MQRAELGALVSFPVQVFASRRSFLPVLIASMRPRAERRQKCHQEKRSNQKHDERMFNELMKQTDFFFHSLTLTIPSRARDPHSRVVEARNRPWLLRSFDAYFFDLLFFRPFPARNITSISPSNLVRRRRDGDLSLLSNRTKIAINPKTSSPIKAAAPRT